ncbi:MAG: tetratricopeptide repeat protein [Verrucomicrobiia bacterium]
MTAVLTPEEEAQLQTTIEMFEVIVQSQPNDYQSWEILKEAYSKLGREKEALNASKRIAEAYIQLGQFSSAILEYETILQRYPDDPDVRKALEQIERRASSTLEQLPQPAISSGYVEKTPPGVSGLTEKEVQLDDGRPAMYKLFVESKLISPGDFELCWPVVDLRHPPQSVNEPFIQALADKNIAPVEKSLSVLCEKTRYAYIPLERYDVDVELARSFPKETCLRWCVLPFDKMSKSVMVGTTNPFNAQALRELSNATSCRIVWYIAPPQDLIKLIKKIFRV